MLKNTPNTPQLHEQIQGVEMPKWFWDLLKKIESGVIETAEVVEKIPQVAEFCESLKDMWKTSEICSLLEEKMSINSQAKNLLS